MLQNLLGWVDGKFVAGFIIGLLGAFLLKKMIFLVLLCVAVFIAWQFIKPEGEPGS